MAGAVSDRPHGDVEHVKAPAPVTTTGSALVKIPYPPLPYARGVETTHGGTPGGLSQGRSAADAQRASASARRARGTRAGMGPPGGGAAAGAARERSRQAGEEPPVATAAAAAAAVANRGNGRGG